MGACLFLLFVLHPLSVVLGAWFGGVWWFATIFLSLLVYPLLESMVPDVGKTRLGKLSFHPLLSDLVMYLASAVVLVLVAWSLVYVSQRQLQAWQWLALAYSVGLVGGTLGITLAHELMHRASRFDRRLSRLLLLLVGYSHFQIAHVRSHHLLAATITDAASARFGQSVYAFLWQSLSGSYLQAWHLEAAKCLRECGFAYHPWANSCIASLGLQFTLYALIVLFLGFGSLGFFILQGVLAIMVLETINYIQHYGLRRDHQNGQVDSMQNKHAWDSSAISNFALFNLGLHGEHHTAAARPFYVLSSANSCNRLPAGYFTMAFLALIPPLWRRVMHRQAALKAFG